MGEAQEVHFPVLRGETTARAAIAAAEGWDLPEA